MENEETNLEVDIDLDLSAVTQRLANDQDFLSALRANQIKRGRLQSNIYGRFAQQQKAPQQTRKLY